MGKRIYLIVMLLSQIDQWKACSALITNQEGDANKLPSFEIAEEKNNGGAPRTKRTIQTNAKLWRDGSDGWPEVPYSIIADAEACKENFKSVGSQCLYFSSTVASWRQAKRSCQLMDAKLTNINYINNFREYMRNQFGGQSFWVGANDQHREGPWTMIHARTGPPQKHCIEYGANGNFNDEHCFKVSKYICEQNVGPLGQVKPAIAHWESNTCITFKEVEPDYPKKFIKVVKRKGCNANSVGAPKRRKHMRISIGKGCGVPQAIHEFGHALGYGHEHSRNDYNKYLTKYIKDGDGWVQNLKTHQTRNDVPYDFTSIMHKSPAIPGVKKLENMKKKQNILMPHNPYDIRLIRHPKQLSWREIKAANIAYKCINKWRKLFPNAADCLNSGYIGKDGLCNCPPGTKGDRCQTRYAGYYSPLTCGGNVTSWDMIQPERKNSFKKERCMWWIQAPKCQKVQLTVLDFNMPKCRMNKIHLEIRTGDVRLPGKLYCKKRLRPGSILTSEDNEMFIDYKGRPSRHGFLFNVDFINNPDCVGNHRSMMEYNRFHRLSVWP